MSDELMTALSAPFELWQHEYRKQGKGDDITGYLTYVGIEHAIGQLNKVLGSKWSVTVVEIRPFGNDLSKPAFIAHVRISYTDASGNPQHRDGIGAAQWTSSADDLDKVVKSSMAEAFKKATHQFGMAGYLWDKGLADQIAVQLLATEGRQWEAKYRPKQPTKGSPIAKAILPDLKEQAQGQPKKQAAKPAAQPQTPAAKTDEPQDADWLKAFDELKAFVKEGHPDAGPAQWTATITNLVDGRFKTKSPRAVSAADLSAFVSDLKKEPATNGSK